MIYQEGGFAGFFFTPGIDRTYAILFVWLFLFLFSASKSNYPIIKMVGLPEQFFSVDQDGLLWYL